jgi:hypothetical protein
MYMIALETEDGIPLSHPEVFGDMQEARDFVGKCPIKMVPGSMWLIYECRYIETVKEEPKGE